MIPHPMGWLYHKQLSNVDKAMFYNTETGRVSAIVITDRDPVELIVLGRNPQEEQRLYFISLESAKFYLENQYEIQSAAAAALEKAASQPAASPVSGCDVRDVPVCDRTGSVPAGSVH